MREACCPTARIPNAYVHDLGPGKSTFDDFEAEPIANKRDLFSNYDCNWSIGLVEVSETKDESHSAQDVSSPSFDDRSTTSSSPDVVAPEEASVLLPSPVRDNYDVFENWSIGLVEVSETKDESHSAQDVSSLSVDDKSTTSASPDVVASKIPEEASVLLPSPVRDNYDVFENWSIGRVEVSETMDESHSAQDVSSLSVDDKSTTSASPDVVASKIPEEASVLLPSPVRDNDDRMQSESDISVPVRNEAPPVVHAPLAIPSASIQKLIKNLITLDTAKNHTKNVSSSVLLSNGTMMSLTLLRTNTMAPQKNTFSKANVFMEPATYSFQPTQLQDMGDFGNSPNPFERSNTDGGSEQSRNGSEQSRNESSDLQEQRTKKNDLENENLSYKGTDNFMSEGVEDVSCNKGPTDLVCHNFPLKVSAPREVDRDKEPPDAVPMKDSFHCQLSSNCPFQEASYNPNLTLLVCSYNSKNIFPSIQEVNVPFNIKKSPMPEELAGLPGDGYKSIGMLKPLSIVKLSELHNPQVGNLLLPIEATTHPPTTIATNRTQTVLLDSIPFLAFGTLVCTGSKR